MTTNLWRCSVLPRRLVEQIGVGLNVPMLAEELVRQRTTGT
jgi:hypothetical protein